MTQLIFLIAFISAEKHKFTQTLNVGINSPTTENAYTGTMFVPRPWIQIVNIAVELDKHELEQIVRDWGT